jgi:hypothetical protein
VIYLGIIIVLLVAILAIPFEVIFKVQRDQEMKSDIAIRWLFGVVRFPVVKEPSEKPAAKARKTKKKTQKKPKSKTGSVNFEAVKNLFLNAKFRYRLIRFVKDIFKSIRIASFYLRIRLGLDDPADTGRLWAYLGPVAVYLSNVSNTTIQLEPEFQLETFNYDGSGKIRIVPLQVIFTVLAFILSPITIHALWQMNKTAKR